MAAKLKKPPSFIAKCELGERRVDPVEMVYWCRACKIRPADAMKTLDTEI